MESLMRQIGTNLKQFLMLQDKSQKIKGVLGMKECLEEFNKDDTFIKVVLDLDIHNFLLQNLMSLNYPITMNVLECVERLCCHEIYFAHDHAVQTAEYVLKSIYFEIKQPAHNDYLKSALQLLTNIFIRLNNFYASKFLPVERIIDTAKDLLESKVDTEIICVITSMFSALLTYELLQKYLNENILYKIELVWQMSVQKLSQIYKTDRKNVVVALCLLCDNSMRFSQKILQFKNHSKIAEFHKNVIETSAKCFEVVCIPYVANVAIQSNHLCAEYLCFLETLLKSALPKAVLVKLSKQIVSEKNFNVIAQYIDLSESVGDSDYRKIIRQFCLSIISEIMAKLTLENNAHCPFSEDKYTKYILKGLDAVPSNVHAWLSLLGNADVSFHSKLSIITFSRVFYVHSNSLQELHSSHLNCFVIFLNEIPFSIQIVDSFLKDLWLLFAIVYSAFPEEATKVRGFRKANGVLQRLLITHSTSLDNILTYHPSILYWSCLAPGIRRQMQLDVFAFWLKRAENFAMYRTALVTATKNCNSASYVLLYLAKKGAPEYARSATEILRISLQHGFLAQNETFTNMLCMYVSQSINEINKEEIVRERVVNSIYLLQLGSYTSAIPEVNMIEYAINNFTNLLRDVGINELLPTVFYVKAFEYTNGILLVSKERRFHQVFATFMNSERTLYVFMTALLSANLDVSIGASRIFINLLDYQSSYELECKKNLTVPNNSLIKILSSAHIEQLLLNLQILYKLLNSSKWNPILKIFAPMDDNFMKGLYLRCLNLSCKPGFQEISEHSYKCLEAILNYSQTNQLAVHTHLLNHPGNHTLIIIYFDEETSRSVDRAFLNFLFIWLFYAEKNKVKIFNKLSINYILWRESLVQIIEHIVDGRSFTEVDNFDVIYNIVSRIMAFSEILPKSIVNKLRDGYNIV